VKRGIFDTIRRGFDSTLTNWQLSLIRWVEVLVFAAIAVGAVLVILLPVFVSIGINLSEITDPDDLTSLGAALLSKWAIAIWVLVAAFVLITVFCAIHAFVEAGVARVLVDADRIAGPAVADARTRYRVFSMDRWMAGGKDGWWDVFLIYAAIWGIGGVILLIPAIALAVLMFLFREAEAAMVAVSCLGLVMFFAIAFVVAIVMGMWTNRAIVQWANDRRGVSAAVSEGSRAVRADLGRHLAILVVIIAVSFGASIVFSSFSFLAAVGETVTDSSPAFLMVTMPLRILVTVLGWGVSAFTTTWYLASYAALAVEGRR
jgi:hypothetical protein